MRYTERQRGEKSSVFYTLILLNSFSLILKQPLFSQRDIHNFNSGAAVNY